MDKELIIDDYCIRQIFKKLASVHLSEAQQKLVKSLRSWRHKTGGLSTKQVELLKRITDENAI
jgi:hypothetical protein